MANGDSGHEFNLPDRDASGDFQNDYGDSDDNGGSSDGSSGGSSGGSSSGDDDSWTPPEGWDSSEADSDSYGDFDDPDHDGATSGSSGSGSNEPSSGSTSDGSSAGGSSDSSDVISLPDRDESGDFQNEYPDDSDAGDTSGEGTTDEWTPPEGWDPSEADAESYGDFDDPDHAGATSGTPGNRDSSSPSPFERAAEDAVDTTLEEGIEGIDDNPRQDAAQRFEQQVIESEPWAEDESDVAVAMEDGRMIAQQSRSSAVEDTASRIETQRDAPRMLGGRVANTVPDDAPRRSTRPDVGLDPGGGGLGSSDDDTSGVDESDIESQSITVPDFVPGIGGREITGQARDVEVRETDSGEVVVEEQERFGDFDIPLPEFLPGVGGQEFEEVTGEAGERLIGAGEAAGDVLARELVEERTVLPGAVVEEQLTGDTSFTGSATRNVPVGVAAMGDQLLNLPQETAEFGAYAGREVLLEGRGGVSVDAETVPGAIAPQVTGVEIEDEGFAQDVASAGTGIAILTGREARRNPGGFTGQLAGSVVATGGGLAAANRLAGPRTARALSVAVQPGEEAAIAAGRAGAISGRTARLVPGVRQGHIASGAETEVDADSGGSRLPSASLDPVRRVGRRIARSDRRPRASVERDSDAGTLELEGTPFREQARQAASSVRERAPSPSPPTRQQLADTRYRATERARAQASELSSDARFAGQQAAGAARDAPRVAAQRGELTARRGARAVDEFTTDLQATAGDLRARTPSVSRLGQQARRSGAAARERVQLNALRQLRDLSDFRSDVGFALSESAARARQAPRAARQRGELAFLRTQRRVSDFETDARAAATETRARVSESVPALEDVTPSTPDASRLPGSELLRDEGTRGPTLGEFGAFGARETAGQRARLGALRGRRDADEFGSDLQFAASAARERVGEAVPRPGSPFFADEATRRPAEPTESGGFPSMGVPGFSELSSGLGDLTIRVDRGGSGPGIRTVDVEDLEGPDPSAGAPVFRGFDADIQTGGQSATGFETSGVEAESELDTQRTGTAREVEVTGEQRMEAPQRRRSPTRPTEAEVDSDGTRIGFREEPTFEPGQPSVEAPTPGLDIDQGPGIDAETGVESVIGPDVETGVESRTEQRTESRSEERLEFRLESRLEQRQEQRLEGRVEQRLETRAEPSGFPKLPRGDSDGGSPGFGGLAGGVFTDFRNPLTGGVLETESSQGSQGGPSIPGFGDVL